MRGRSFTGCLLSSMIMMLIVPGILFAQDKKAFKRDFLEAEYFFLRGNFPESAFLYDELLHLDPLNANLQFLTGASWLSVQGNKEKSIFYLEKAVNSISPGYREGSYREKNAPRESLFALARAYHISNRFNEASAYYKKYKNVMKLSEVAEIEFVHKQLESVELARQLIKDTLEFTYTELENFINSGPDNFNAVYAEKDSCLVYMIQKPFYSAIMMTRMSNDQWQTPRVINPELKADGDCKLASISADGKELFLVKNENYDKNIYHSTFVNGKWTDMKPLPVDINSEYNESHASLSADGRKLFFTSDRPGGMGAMDIYIADRDEAGNWGRPVNAGPVINTIYSEETPFLTGKGNVLFFSSMGHPTMGGFDIFYSRLLPGGNWSHPVNMGFPINTTDDDLFYFPLGEGKQGLMTSYQDMLAKGRIIMVNLDNEKPDRKYEFRGRISTADNREIEMPTEVRVKNTRTGDVVAVTQLSKDSSDYAFDLEAGEYTVEIKTDNYTVDEKNISIIPEMNQNTIVVNSELEPEEVSEGKFLIMKNILFAFDSEALNEDACLELEKLALIMKRYPEIYVQVRGHADAMGPESYNMNLSRRRSRSVINYLVEKDISKERFISSAVGESFSLARNFNPDGSDNPEGRRLNRQVEISLVNNEHENINLKEILVPEHLKPAGKTSWVLLLGEEEGTQKEIKEFSGLPVKIIRNDSAGFHYCDHFNNKEEAVRILNEAIDKGFPEARIVSSEDFGDLKNNLKTSGHLPKPPFTIQLMALRNPADFSYFTEPSEIQLFESSDGYHRYVTGIFNTYDQAKNKLDYFIQKGFNDAFVMEMERYTAVYRSREDVQKTPDIYYTIQFTATRKPPDQQNIEHFKNFRIVKGADGFYRCSTGFFTQKEEAVQELQKIKKLGFEDAFINRVPINNSHL